MVSFKSQKEGKHSYIKYQKSNIKIIRGIRMDKPKIKKKDP